MLKHRQKDFQVFKLRCKEAGIPLPEHVQLASMKPRKYKKDQTRFMLVSKERYSSVKRMGRSILYWEEQMECLQVS